MSEGDIIPNGRKIEDKLQADCYFYNGPMVQQAVYKLKEVIIAKPVKHKRACLFLTTNGGDPNAAYRLVSCLKKFYPDTGYALLSFGWCKSAGTLAAIGATELVFSHHGELGPLDVQLNRRDDVFGYNSGMDILAAISSVIENTQSAFDKHFLDICRKGGGNISIKLAAEIATNISTKLFSGIVEQIPPLQLGETQRAMEIALSYSKILRPSNITPQSVMKLMTGYPSHDFVIDINESKNLFKNVREPTREEAIVGLAMNMACLSQEPQIASLEDINVDDQLVTLVTGENHEQRPHETSTAEESGNVTPDSGVVKPLRSAKSR